MAIRPHVPLDERLLILRALDQLRTWNSLDDERSCILCERTFSGRQVEISRSHSGNFQLHCPTEGCNATPSQWVYSGNPFTSEAAYQDWQRTLIEGSTDSPASAAA